MKLALGDYGDNHEGLRDYTMHIWRFYNIFWFSHIIFLFIYLH